MPTRGPICADAPDGSSIQAFKRATCFSVKHREPNIQQSLPRLTTGLHLRPPPPPSPASPPAHPPRSSALEIFFLHQPTGKIFLWRSWANRAYSFQTGADASLLPRDFRGNLILIQISFFAAFWRARLLPGNLWWMPWTENRGPQFTSRFPYSRFIGSDRAVSFHLLAVAAMLGASSSGLHGNAIVCQPSGSSKYRGASVIRATLARNVSQPSGAGRGKLNKVVLAYSGGLDTSVIVPWLRENYGCDVVCFTADVGQGMKEMEGLEAKAKASGASQLVVKDLREEFVSDYIFPCLRAGALYERKYLLGTSMARPLIAKAMVDVAKEVGADAVSHGCTGKGNDQVRFELAFYALSPELNVVAPWREWEIKGREDAIEYAKKHNVPVPVTKKSIYSRDRNLWHISHEGGILEDPANQPEKDMFMMTEDPEDAPDQPEYLEVGIVSGLPISINGKALSPASLLAELNEIGARHGIGRVDMVENRLVGMKSRGVYETPGGTLLFDAVRELESLTLDREAMQFKDSMALKYAEMVYAGRWFDPFRVAMDAFMEKITETTTGSVTLKLYKGSVTIVSRKSPFSLYNEDLSSFESGDIYDQADAAGFIRLYGLPTRVRAMLEKDKI